MLRRALLPLSRFLLVTGAAATFAAGCALETPDSQGPIPDVGPARGPDAGAGAATPTEDLPRAEGRSDGRRVVLGYFEGRVDPRGGTFELRMIPELGPLSEEGAAGPAGFAVREQGLCDESDYIVVQDGTPGSGPPDSIEVVTNPASLLQDLACDAGWLPLFDPPLFCATVTVRSFYGSLVLEDVFAEILSMSDTSHLGWNSDLEPDPGNAPFDAWGLWSYGDLQSSGSAPFNENAVQWIFERNNDTYYSFMGRIVGVAAESCDGIDNDCDGSVDEEGGATLFADVDGDLFGDSLVSSSACVPPPGYVADNTDCDDSDTNVNPGMSEICDLLDNDCNGWPDDDGLGGPYTQLCYSGPPPTLGVGLCAAGTTTCIAGSWGACLGEVLPAAEVCDGFDNDCDGVTDETGSTTWYRDADGDAYGVTGDSIVACGPSAPYLATWDGDCNDGNPVMNPGQAEVCDSLDNDCDSLVDEGVCAPPTIVTGGTGTITQTSAQMFANLTALGDPAWVLDRGICYSSTDATPEIGDVGVTCVSFGATGVTGGFSVTESPLSQGTLYWYQAYAINGAGTSYGGVGSYWTIPPTPTGVNATDATLTDRVTISWSASAGATTYDVYRDAVLIMTGVGGTTYDDFGAAAGTSAPNAPGSLLATDGDLCDRVNFSYAAATVPDGAVHSYTVAAVNSSGVSPVSSANGGNRAGSPVTGYEVSLDGGAYFSNGMATVYVDFSPPLGTINPGTLTASDGTSSSHVALSVTGVSSAPGPNRAYRVRAVNAYGTGPASGPENGYRSVCALAFTFDRSAGDSDSNYSNVYGPSGLSTYNDTGAPAGGQGRYYRALISAVGASPVYTSSDRGYRLVVPESICNDLVDNDSDGQTDCLDADCASNSACYGYFVLIGTQPNGNLGGITGARTICVNALTSGSWLGKANAQARGLLTSAHVDPFLCTSGGCLNGRASRTYAFATTYSAGVGGATFTTDLGGLGQALPTDRSVSTVWGTYSDVIWTGRNGGPLCGSMPNVVGNTCQDWTNGSLSFGGGNHDSGSSNCSWGSSLCAVTYFELACWVHPDQ